MKIGLPYTISNDDPYYYFYSKDFEKKIPVKDGKLIFGGKLVYENPFEYKVGNGNPSNPFYLGYIILYVKTCASFFSDREIRVC